MTAKRLRIAGRVQGVGFRDWLQSRAEALGVSGWVRNCTDGSVEALLHGDPAAVEALLRECRRGPRHADVTAVTEDLGEPAPRPGFHRLPSA